MRMGINRVGDFWLKKNKEVTPPPLPTRASQREMSGSDYFEKDFGKSRVQLIQDILDRLGPTEVHMDSGTDIEELVRQTPTIRQELHTYDEPIQREQKEAETTYVRNIVGATAMAAAFILSFAAGAVVSSQKQDAISTPSYVRPKESDEREAPDPEKEEA